MAIVSLVACIRLIRNSFNFYQKIHRTQSFFQKLQKAGNSGTVCRPPDEQTSDFSTFWCHIYSHRVFLKYAKSYSNLSRCICMSVSEIETLLDLPRCFERSLVKQSRVYVVIVVTDVTDYISNKNIT